MGMLDWSRDVCAAAALMAAFGLTSCKSQKEQAEYEAKRQALLAKNAAAEKAREDDAIATRKACKMKPTDPVNIDPSHIVGLCQDAVNARLRFGRGDFPYGEHEHVLKETAGCGRRLVSQYTAKNAAGTEVSNRYVCDYDPKTDSVRIQN